MSIGVVHATPESAITIKPEISGDEDRGPCEEGKELKPVGEPPCGKTHLFERTLTFNAKADARHLKHGICNPPICLVKV